MGYSVFGLRAIRLSLCVVWLARCTRLSVLLGRSGDATYKESSILYYTHFQSTTKTGNGQIIKNNNLFLVYGAAMINFLLRLDCERTFELVSARSAFIPCRSSQQWRTRTCIITLSMQCYKQGVHIPIDSPHYMVTLGATTSRLCWLQAKKRVQRYRQKRKQTMRLIITQ
jgi:hypothetical protein